jgi:acyl-CoA thioesterase
MAAPAPAEIARRAAAAMYERDHAAKALGIALEAVGPGTARCTMTVRTDMVNGHGICHGGLIFSLADTAFAYACNAYDQASVAQHCGITFLAAVPEGSRLTAAATELSLAGRSGLYDVRVTDETGRAVAEFRGHSRRIGGTVTREAMGTREATGEAP